MSTVTALRDPDVVAAIESAPDATLAHTTLERIVEVAPDVADDVVRRAGVRDGLIALACASRSLTNALIQDPSLVDVLRHLDEPITAMDASDPGALRRSKRRELLRIAAADLLGLLDFPTVGRRLADLADECLRAALELAGETLPFTVIGMGKLGGRELNYASDVDVLFVHDGDGAAAERVARRVLTIMSEPTADGVVFRTDADLRPEGRAGALSRSVDGYAAWYERWARPWEFQALIKARPVAGDATVAEHFIALTQPYVWPEVLDPDAVREVRAMKARAEAEVRRRGLGDRELKRGRGGIRDVEFATQLLQLVHGREDPRVRSATTLDALDELAGGGYIEAEDARQLRDAYTFLRTVEHRLQLRDEQQTHTLPADPASRTLLARVLGYRDEPATSALESFDADQQRQQGVVRQIHERLFFAPLLDTLAGTGPLSPEAAEERLAAFGFVDADHTRRALHELTQGLTRTSRTLQQLLPAILDWLSASPDPDLGLLQLRRLAEGPARAMSLATTFRDRPGAAERACRVLGSSRIIGDALLRQPEIVELLGDDDWLVRERGPDELRDAALATLEWRQDTEARRSGLRRFKRRELLRVASRDVVGLAPLDVTSRELAGLADACVEGALTSLGSPVPFAVIGMGRLGGRELSYSSDIDVLFVYDGAAAADFEAAEATATALVAEISATTSEGQTFRVDARLRPEGKNGPLARSLDGYRAYYERWALPWELQALLRARPVAGDTDLGHRFCTLLEPFVYRDPFPEDAAREVRRIKARIERERIPPGEDPQFHFKLGKGALTDIEFTVQLLQLQHGAHHPSVRVAATVPALQALGAEGLLAADDVSVLAESYMFCARARNACYLVTGLPTDSLPAGDDGARVSRLLGILHHPEAELRDEYRRVTRRARRVVERVFYGRD